MPSCCERCCSYLRIFFAVLGILAGSLSSPVFYFQYSNYHAATWAVISVIFATAALHMALMLHKDSIHDWYSEPQLHNIKLMAFFVTDVTVATFLGYLFYAYYYSIPMLPVDGSFYVSSVWVFMTAKWSFMLWKNADTAVKRILRPPLDF